MTTSPARTPTATAVRGQPDPRLNQKQRTRAALVDAATELLRAGRRPTVPEAAEHARVSRATAYRYFPTQEALLTEISRVNPTTDRVEAWIRDLRTGNPSSRLAGLLEVFNPIVLSEQVALREGLRVYLETWLSESAAGNPDPVVREGRRIRWLDEVLGPVREQMSAAQWRRLRSALALTLGIEAMVIQKDVCRLADKEALEVLGWVAQTLLAAALREAPGSKAARQRRS
jgi:AcrR family transcriptional regulator